MNTQTKKVRKEADTIQACMMEILFKQCDDASEIIQQLINAEINDDYHDILSILDSSKEWKQIARQCNDNIRRLMDFLHEIKLARNGVSIEAFPKQEALEQYYIGNDKDYLRVLYGNACYIAGLKKGIQLMRFSDGTATVNDLVL